jgi:hypothetical protein
MLCAENTGDNSGESCADIDGFSKPGKTIAEKAAAELLKEQEAAKVDATKRQLAKDSYKQGLEKLLLRKQRAEEKAQKEKLAAITEENKLFASGDGDIRDHQTKLGKIQETYDKAIGEAYREYDKALENLRKSNPTGYDAYRGW